MEEKRTYTRFNRVLYSLLLLFMIPFVGVGCEPDLYEMDESYVRGLPEDMVMGRDTTEITFEMETNFEWAMYVRYNIELEDGQEKGDSNWLNVIVGSSTVGGKFDIEIGVRQNPSLISRKCEVVVTTRHLLETFFVTQIGAFLTYTLPDEIKALQSANPKPSDRLSAFGYEGVVDVTSEGEWELEVGSGFSGLRVKMFGDSGVGVTKLTHNGNGRVVVTVDKNNDAMSATPLVDTHRENELHFSYQGVKETLYIAQEGANITEIFDSLFAKKLYDRSIIPDNSRILIADVKDLTNLTIEGEAGVDSLESLGGIEYFESLQRLNVNHNILKNIDLSWNANLIELDCENNLLSSLTLLNHKALRRIDVESNGALTSLDISSCIELEELVCSKTGIASLITRNSTKLKRLDCGDCKKLGTLKIGQNKLLESLVAAGSGLSSVDFARSVELTSLDISSTKVTNLNIVYCTKLVSLECSGNQGDTKKPIEMTEKDENGEDIKVTRYPFVVSVWRGFDLDSPPAQFPVDGLKWGYEIGDIEYGIILKYDVEE